MLVGFTTFWRMAVNGVVILIVCWLFLVFVFVLVLGFLFVLLFVLVLVWHQGRHHLVSWWDSIILPSSSVIWCFVPPSEFC